MYLLLPLGNPGSQYSITRHNVGWIAIDALFPDTIWHEHKYAKAEVATVEIGDQAVTIAKPQTFMNDSGETAHYFIEKENVLPEEIIVVYDDLDLPLGKIKISFDRGSGGHNGIKSVEAALGSREFIRLRVGISKIMEDGKLISPNVLGHFDPEELQVVKNLAPQVGKIIGTIVTEGKERAMTMFNQ